MTKEEQLQKDLELQAETIGYLRERIAELEKACEETQELLDKQIEATYRLDKEKAELEERFKCFIDNLKNIVYAGDYYTAADLQIIKLISKIEEAKKND